MPAIARRTVLSAALLLVLTLSLHADTHQQIVDLLANMTASLAEDNVDGFMKGFDHNMPGYGDLKRQIEGLVLDYEISSSVEPIADEGSGDKRSFDLDWYMELTSRVETGPTVRRRKVVHCDLELQGKHWRIVSLTPLSFFTDKAE
jgi:hypothetical protein